MRRRRGALPLLSDAFFYGYTGTCVVAGATGAAFGNSDVALISGFRAHDELPERPAATMMSQHRFLRAMEMGFGMFSLQERERIHRDRSSNRLFLSLMFSGIAARGVARLVDGRPRANAYLFAGSELLGLTLIFAHTRSTLRR
jgi:Domain of unknown function (DUF4345)